MSSGLMVMEQGAAAADSTVLDLDGGGGSDIDNNNGLEEEEVDEELGHPSSSAPRPLTVPHSQYHIVPPNRNSEPVRTAPKIFLKAMPGGTFQSSSSSSIINNNNNASGSHGHLSTVTTPLSTAALIRQPQMRLLGPPPPSLFPRSRLIDNSYVAAAAMMMRSSVGEVQQAPTRSGELTITKVPSQPKAMAMTGSNLTETITGSNDMSSPSFLPNQRFLSGKRNFLKPRKTLPGLNPIGNLSTATPSSLPTNASFGYGHQDSPSLSQSPTLQSKLGTTGISLNITKTVIPSSSPSSSGGNSTQPHGLRNSTIKFGQTTVNSGMSKSAGIVGINNSTHPPVGGSDGVVTLGRNHVGSLPVNSASTRNASGGQRPLMKPSLQASTPSVRLQPNHGVINNLLNQKGRPSSPGMFNLQQGTTNPRGKVPTLKIAPLLKVPQLSQRTMGNSVNNTSGGIKSMRVKPPIPRMTGQFPPTDGQGQALKIRRGFESAAISAIKNNTVPIRGDRQLITSTASTAATVTSTSSLLDGIGFNHSEGAHPHSHRGEVSEPDHSTFSPSPMFRSQSDQMTVEPITIENHVKRKLSPQSSMSALPPAKFRILSNNKVVPVARTNDAEAEGDDVVSSTKEDESGNEQDGKTLEDMDGGRRTGRRRKPTKLFAADFIPSTRGRRRGENLSLPSKLSIPVPEGLTITSVSSVEVESMDLASAASTSAPMTPFMTGNFGRGRGRPRGSGRGRGRPRGSTLRARIERHDDLQGMGMARGSSPESSPEKETIKFRELTSEAEAILNQMKQNFISDTPSEAEGTPTALPTRGRGRGRGRGTGFSRGTPTPRGSRGGRGSRGSRGGRRLLLAKRRKPKLAEAQKAGKSTPEVFEEETRMSASADIKPSLMSDKVYTAPSTPTGILPDEDASNMSSTSNSTATKGKKFTKETIEERKPVTAETLFEYKWPLDNPDAEFYFLQEQIIEYLGHKGFRRKYPNLQRRSVEVEERDYLREQKVVSETQCDLGLTAVISSDVLDIMYSDFPDKHEEYRRVEEDRREKELTRAQPSTATSTRDRSAEFLRRVTKSCSKWNSTFNHERKELRSYFFDLQTCTIHVPAGTKKVLPPEQTQVGYYPVAVLPGQYTDSYKSYSPVELKYLPLNTVMYGPMVENTVNEDSEDSESDSEASTSSDDSSSSSSEDEEDTMDNTSIINGPGTPYIEDIKDTQGICKTCSGDCAKNKDGKPEILIHCAKCDSANHPTCLELSLDMVPFIKKYNWQCTDCKNCIECNDPADEDKMLFCDCCDRGYHIYCVGLRKVPTGRWHCISCSFCHSCGVNEPSATDRTADWHHEYKKGEKGTKFFLHSFCVSCHKIYKKGQYCPICLKCHVKLNETPVLECRSCEKWVHKSCTKRSLQVKLGFICDLCDVDSFAEKNKIPIAGRRMV